jgi:type I restriction enzyme R subunit
LPAAQPAGQLEGHGSGWPDGEGSHFEVPFVYSCNGRPTSSSSSPRLSGTWFRDVRRPANSPAAARLPHPGWPARPAARSRAEAEAKLQQEGFAYLRLRDYQQHAPLQAVEAALAAGQSQCLLAMATGTGKTRTIIGLMYRLLKAERFRRILFLVDRTALGTRRRTPSTKPRSNRTMPLSKIYNVAELGDMAAEAETRVQVATVQAMVQAHFSSDDTAPGIDAFDCIIVDEAHRGYTLDQDMTEGEQAGARPGAVPLAATAACSTTSTPCGSA